MSTNTLDTEELAAGEDVFQPLPVARPARNLLPTTALAAPIVAALAALSVHHYVRDKLLPPMSWLDALPAWKHPYPLLLWSLLVASLISAAAQWAWPRLRRWYLHYGPLLAGGIGILCALELITIKWAWMPQSYFPSPDDILGGLIEDHALLLVSAWHSLRLLLSGYVLGVAAGLVSGVLIGWFPVCRYWGMPVLKLIGPIPATALVPLAMTLIPAALSFFSGTVLIAFAVWFPMTMLTASGIANVRLSYLDVARTLGAGRLYLIFRVAIPAAMPNIFLGLFQGLCASFLTLIVAETIGVKAGLGWYLQWQKGYAEYGKVYASLVIMAVFFSTLLTLLFKLRDRLLKWQNGVIKW